ncbi:hypothetical protein FDA94_14550 [Herbidospora galbida]|uniref:Uncharacterized protein n=1 Tax=Herbidospora galbida TaxID=2575442 RepID=A0A4U3MJE3_9ACTN|nr:hypothetical protein [Herbidospora galbida]TKK88137.1 hypothetical protein FDA94_14550 [Herbidospora galbida]
MPPCLDVYVWIPERRPGIFGRFIESYVADPGEDHRLQAFTRTYVLGITTEADADEGFSLYLRGREHYQAIICVARDGAAVLGLSVEAPDNRQERLTQAAKLIEQLRRQFSAPAGLAGVELPPPRDHAEWQEEFQVELRVGAVPT